MKKNLIGIVAAGLALALAFTGCESGSDSPVKYATDLDNPVTKGSKFTYVANPTEYAPAAAATETPSGTVGSYDWVSYIDGVNKFNRNTSATVASRTTNVDGKTGGDVIKTKKVTITLNDKDKTFSVLEETTTKEVFDIVEFGATTAGYDSVKVLPVKEATTIPSGNAFAVTPAAVAATYTDCTVANGYVATTSPATGYNDAKGIIDAAITTIKGQKKDYVVSAADKAYNEAVDKDIKKLTELKNLIDAKWYGAVKVIVETDAAAKTTTSYLKADGSNAIAPVVATGTAPKAKTGTYKFLSGNYKDGSILVTSYDKVTWDDASGDYVNDGYKGKIAIDYPEAGAIVGGKVGVIGNKSSRTLTISGGTITAPKTITSYTDSTGATTPKKTYGFFLGSSQTKYFDTSVAPYATATGDDVTTAATFQSYSYVLKQ